MTIRPTSFFRVALVLPALAPIAALPFGVNSVVAILMLSLQFGGIQYLVFALVVFVMLGRMKSLRSRLVLLWMSPVLFIPIQFIGWVVRQYIERFLNPELVLSWESIYPMITFTLILGYGYVILVAAVFALGRWGRLIAADSQ